MRAAQVDACLRPGESREDERASFVDRESAIALAERVVKEAGQDVFFFDRTAKPLEERVLRRVVHDPVAARDQQLCRCRDRLCVGDHSIGGFIQPEQDVDCDRTGDERIGLVRGDALRVVRQELRFHVAVDEELAPQLVQQRKPGARKRYVQLDLEGGRSQHRAANLGGIVVQPGCCEDCPDALRNNRYVPDRDAVRRDDVIDERLDVAHRRAERGAEAALARRPSVPARIPGEELELRQIQLVDQMRHTSGVLVPAVKQHHGLPCAVVVPAIAQAR